MSEHRITKSDIDELVKLLHAELENEQAVNVSIKSASIGKWGMARLWRKWMSQTADFMADNGARMPLMIGKDGKPYGKRRFSAQDAHELFTSQWLGIDEKGKRLSWARMGSNGSRAATKGERFLAMLKHQNWCIEKGINLFNPSDSEFSKLDEQQNQ